MLKRIQKIPAGLLLIPMLIAAILNTINPHLFRIGTVTEALFTGQGTNYIIGFACFCSGTVIEVKKIFKVLKLQGVLIIVKTLVCIIFSKLYVQFFGMEGILGVSALAFIITIASTNPSIYLSAQNEYGTEMDVAAFGLMGLVCTPAYAMIIYSSAYNLPIDWMPIISVLVPIIIGMLLGNLDEDFRNLFKPGLVISLPFMGFSFGSGINLINAIKAGPSGVVLAIMYYIVNIPILLMVERKVLKSNGISSIAMSSIAGLSISVVLLIAKNNHQLFAYSKYAIAQIAMGVVITSAITPIIIKKWAEKTLKKA